MGRTRLLGLIDGLITIPPENAKPVLVLEGSGGSGRTALLDQVMRRWTDRTPVALVRPLAHPYAPDNALRPVNAAAMLGLSTGIRGYKGYFPRVLVALLAIDTDFSTIAPPDQRAHLQTVLNRYRDRDALLTFVDAVAGAVGDIAASTIPGAAVIVPILANNLSGLVVRRLQHGRMLARITWGSAISWFGHQDLGLVLDAEATLIELGLQAHSDDPAIRRGVDDLLVSALLADLRYSAAKVNGRATNFTMLIDDGDSEPVASFIGSLLRAREALTAVGFAGPDPLTVVTVSSGMLASELAGQVPAPAVWTDPLAPGPWARWALLPLPHLRSTQVETLAMSVGAIQGKEIGARVHRLTGGHAGASALLLARIKENPDFATDIDALLRAPGPEPRTTVQQYLLRVFAKGLSVRKQLNDGVLEALITISAARTKGEATALMDLLPAGLSTDSTLFTSRTLWVREGENDVLPPLVRQLGLRELRTRDDPNTGWDKVFDALLERVDPADNAGRLLYTRLRHGRAAIVEELANLLSRSTTARWLAVFDEVVSVMDPRRPDRGILDSPDRAHNLAEHLEVLLAALPELSSGISFVTAEARVALFSRIAHSYDRLADFADDRAPFAVRATEYRRRAWREQ
ncbi:hypothetical protein [Nocardia sp. NPDC050406]|uniref:hypothetical protein n=1 Tax=Nocardia sp. NPDC050406 TaxID=3364318 RepID=UPI00379295D2